MATSSTATAGTNATAVQYNNLRTDAIRRDVIFQWEVEDDLAILDEQGGMYLAPFGYTVTKVKAWCEAGTCSIRLQKGTTNILANMDVTTSAADVTSFDSASLAENDVLSMDITAVNSGNHVIIQMFATRNL